MKVIEIRDDLAAGLGHAEWLVEHFDSYMRAYRDQLRAGFPTRSMGDGGHSTTTESQVLAFDKHDQWLHQQLSTVAKSVHAAHAALARARRAMGSVVLGSTQPAVDVPKQCIDCGHVFTMQGTDRAHDAAGRCNACRMRAKRTAS